MSETVLSLFCRAEAGVQIVSVSWFIFCNIISNELAIYQKARRPSLTFHLPYLVCYFLIACWLAFHADPSGSEDLGYAHWVIGIILIPALALQVRVCVCVCVSTGFGTKVQFVDTSICHPGACVCEYRIRHRGTILSS